jgi:DNA polymerase III delta prime subunit|tara:strand:+ start:439 stop:1380 length:942 start_codon:yes stop_codon:yes gene_type:complete
MSDFLWVEKYRPQKIDDCILPKRIKDTFKEFVQKGEIPNLLLSGTAGIGKTTVAKALCKEIGVDYYVINGSDEGRFLDTVRSQAKNFASTVSLLGSSAHKVIIIDEADNTTHDVQLLLRAFVEEFHKNCRFIFTCNFKNKIIDPLHSRCSCIDFAIDKNEKQQIAASFFNRLNNILDGEGISFDKRVVAELIQRYFPDWRRVLNECQRYSVSGTIDNGILANVGNSNVDALVGFLKRKDYGNVRKWLVDNLDNDPNMILRSLYDALYTHLEPSSIPSAVLVIAKYQYQIAFVADQEINLLAALTEIMVECNFK